MVGLFLLFARMHPNWQVNKSRWKTDWNCGSAAPSQQPKPPVQSESHRDDMWLWLVCCTAETVLQGRLQENFRDFHWFVWTAAQRLQLWLVLGWPFKTLRPPVRSRHQDRTVPHRTEPSSTEPSDPTSHTLTSRFFIGDSGAADGPAVGRHTPAVPGVAVALNLKTFTRHKHKVKSVKL